MEIALYVRVSTSRQQQTQTIEQQLDRLRAKVATEPNWHLTEEHGYRDDGYSGASLNRPGLDRLRDHAALSAFELVLITAPDRLARKYVHQVLLIDEMQSRGCQVEFLGRPMSDDPHDQLLLQIRGAVAEYERSLIAERMRRGRQAKLRSGTLLPWTAAPYGYILDPEHPRDPSRCPAGSGQSRGGQTDLCLVHGSRATGDAVLGRQNPECAADSDPARRFTLECRLGARHSALAGLYGHRLQWAHPSGAGPAVQIGFAAGGTGREPAARPAGRLDGRTGTRHRAPRDLRSGATPSGSEPADGSP